LEPIAARSEAELLDQLRPGKDGLVIVAYGRRATFLPSVWGQLPEPQQFVAALKAKCGLRRDYWSDQLEFMRYATTSCAESD
jgi:AMMECR1 domain-containing protein